MIIQIKVLFIKFVWKGIVIILNNYTLINLTNEDLKEIQKQSLEIAKYVITFCQEHEIKVYFFAGSLLGAVRHNGFIPWDDDIDLVFPAPDFQKFINSWNQFADKEKYALCLQTKNYNDHTLTGSVRNNMTTFITDSTVELDVNQGLAVDILPLYACPNSLFGQKIQLIFAAGSSLFKAGRIPARQNKTVKVIAKILLGIFRTTNIRYLLWNTLEKIAINLNKKYENAEYVREFTMFPFITWRYPRKWFDKAEFVKFENVDVPIPVGAKEYLTKRYGDYMKLPQEKDRHPEHRIIFMDLKSPYMKYKGIHYFINKS